jgi:predicted AlkP superfamily pyrophosphatase or phosphodiesterase
MAVTENRNIVLIIVDQLRADYAHFLPRCSKLLPYSTVCETNSIPASTEAMHANISTGKYPREHGFISKTGRSRLDGLEEVQELIKSGRLSSIASMAESYSFPVYAIGGKPETIKVVGSAEQCALRVNYDATRGRFLLDGYCQDRFSSLQDFFETAESRSLPQDALDHLILKIAGLAVKQTRQTQSFFILTLPALDSIGHKHGPGSQNIEDHLSVLDSALHDFMESLSGNPSIILMGDHGCRTTLEYAIEASAIDPRQVVVYRMADGNLQFNQHYELDRLQCLKDMQFDGGILRMWYDEGNRKLSPDDFSFLSRFGMVCGAGYNFTEEVALPYEQSSHPNLGDAVVVANKGVTFCKRRWIHSSESRNKISSRDVLDRGDIPVGEHGTFHEEDRRVLLISNRGLGQYEPIEHIKIRSIVEEMMR